MLGFRNAVFDHIADGNDPHQLAVILNRQMADAVFGHQRHDRFHIVRRAAENHVAGHQRIRRLIQQRGALIGQSPHDVAF